MRDLLYLNILSNEYQRRKALNPLYSLRAFALNLDLDPSLLSRILTEKELPSLETAQKICQKLKLNQLMAKHFVLSVSAEKSCQELYHINPLYTDCESTT